MKRLITRIVIALILLTSCEALALDVQLDRPNIGPTGTFTIYGSRTLEPKQFTLGLSTNYTEDPFEFRNFTTGSQVRAIVDYLITTDFSAEVGLHKIVTAGIDVPIHGSRHLLATNLNRYRSYFSIGDIGFYAKIAALHPDDFPIGLSIMPFVTAPTGNINHYVGDRSADLGARIIVDKEFGPAYVGVNVGYKGHVKRETITVTGSTARVDVRNELQFGVGGSVDVIRDRLAVLAEFRGSTTFDGFAKKENSSPMEVNGGLKASFLDKQVNLHIGGGAGLNGGYGAPKYRVFGGVAATFPIKKQEVTTITDIETIILQGVNFFTASAKLTPDSHQVLDQDYMELSKYPDVSFVVVGHTDSRGSVPYNQRLSERRAAAVKNYFIQKGIPTDRITSEGRGKSEPLVPNTSPENMEKNRRVEIQIVPIKILEQQGV